MNARIPPIIKHAICAALLLLLPLSAFAGSARIESGHSAMWVDPSRNGEGWILEILPNDTAALYWYTSDDEGKPRWIISHAPIGHGEDGDRIVFNELITGHGGQFGPEYTADDVTLENVGTAELSFSDCNTGEISFNAYGKTGTYPLTRLTRTMAAGCAPVHGIPGEPVQPYAGTSGTWYVADNPGQAFTLQWLADGAPILFWFAYDPEGNPFWMAGMGQYEEGRIVFPQLDSVQGGRFGEDYPPEQATLVPWGRLELELTCDSGTASYEATAEGFGSGSFNLVPLTRLAKPACPWVKPKLTDLYDLEWKDLPIEYPGNSVLRDVRVEAVANDGTVFGTRANAGFSPVTGTEIVKLAPGSSDWGVLGIAGEAVFREFSHLASDGKTVYALRIIDVAHKMIEVWSEADGWQLLPDTLEAEGQQLTGASLDGRWLVGTSTIAEGGGFAWKWSETTGQIKLSAAEDWPAVVPTAISNNGDVIVGSVFLPVEYEMEPGMPEVGPIPPQEITAPFAIQWFDGNPPQWLLESEDPLKITRNAPHTCNADCSVIFGAGAGELSYTTLPSGSAEAWLRTASGQVELLDAPVTLEQYGGIDRVDASTSGAGGDGSMAFGSYFALRQVGTQYTFNTVAEDAWLWTQYTGSVDLRPVLKDQFGIQTLDWEERRIAHVSADGRWILMAGFQPDYGAGSLRRQRAALLRLTPKPQD